MAPEDRMTTRRSFLAGILAAGFAPAAIGSGILMPVKTIAVPSQTIIIRRWERGLDGVIFARDERHEVRSIADWEQLWRYNSTIKMPKWEPYVGRTP